MRFFIDLEAVEHNSNLFRPLVRAETDQGLICGFIYGRGDRTWLHASFRTGVIETQAKIVVDPITHFKFFGPKFEDHKKFNLPRRPPFARSSASGGAPNHRGVRGATYKVRKSRSMTSPAPLWTMTWCGSQTAMSATMHE